MPKAIIKDAHNKKDGDYWGMTLNEFDGLEDGQIVEVFTNNYGDVFYHHGNGVKNNHTKLEPREYELLED